jgi:hypothetical protein
MNKQQQIDAFKSKFKANKPSGLLGRFVLSGDFAKQQNVTCKTCGYTGALHLAMAPHSCTKDACMAFVPSVSAAPGAKKVAAAAKK